MKLEGVKLFIQSYVLDSFFISYETLQEPAEQSTCLKTLPYQSHYKNVNTKRHCNLKAQHRKT
eukprot:scaffold384590_cov27-Prasinocladus_malaysianus.AAC.1